MGLTKKELQAMITEAVKVAIKEMKPTIRKTIREEFYKIVDEANDNHEIGEQPDDLSMTRLLEQNAEEDETRRVVEKKIFSGGKFSDILNQTADQYRGRSITKEATSGMATNDQQQFILNSDSVQPSQTPDRSRMINEIGYGDGFSKVGEDAKVPGVQKSQTSPLKQILGNTQKKPNQPVQVSLPTKNADGRLIDFDKVPVEVVENMVKDYRGTLKNLEKRSSFVRGGAAGQKKSIGKASLGSFQNPKEQFQFEEDKKK